MLYGIGTALTSSFIKKAMMGAGVGVGSYAGLSSVLDKMIYDSIGILYQGDTIVLQILGLVGVDTALSMILSACLVRFSLSLSLIFFKN